MKIEKLPSGSYRIRKTYKGKSYTVVTEYKPTQKEALQLIYDKLENTPTKTDTNECFGEYLDKYIQKCEDKDLSPSTTRSYVSIKRNIPDWFMVYRFNDIVQSDIQRVVNEYSKGRSPKSVRNCYGLIRCVFKEYRPLFKFSVELPAKIKKAEYEPTTDDIQRILEASEGSRYELVLRLCALALRRGEAIAITSSDLDENNVLSINKDIVLDKDNNYVLKNKPKTEDSNRRILIPSSIAAMLRRQGYAFKGNPHTINEYLHKLQDQLGIPRFRLHYMRHFSAAYLHKEGFTDAQILAYGGWSESSDVMKRVYRYNLDPHESQRLIADTFSEIF